MGALQNSINGALGSIARVSAISENEKQQKEKVRIAQENLDLMKKKTATAELNAQTAAKRAETAAYKAKTDRMQGKMDSKAEMARIANRAAEIKNETRDSKSAAKRAEAQLTNANVSKSRESRLAAKAGKAKTVYDLQTPAKAPETPVEASEQPAGTDMPEAPGNAPTSPAEAPAAAVATEPIEEAVPAMKQKADAKANARVQINAITKMLQDDSIQGRKRELLEMKLEMQKNIAAGKHGVYLVPFASVEERMQDLLNYARKQRGGDYDEYKKQR